MGRIAKAINRLLPGGLKDRNIMQVALWRAGKPEGPPRNFRTYAEEGYGRNEIVYSCIIANAQSADEISLVAQVRDGAEWIRPDDASAGTDRRAGMQLQALLEQPNPKQDQYEWIQDLIVNLMVAGNSYQNVEVSGRMDPVALWHLRPDWVSIIPDPDTLIGGYTYRVDGTGDAVRIEPDRMLHQRLPKDPRNPLYGLAPLSVLARQVDVDNAATDFMKAFFDNMGMPAWLATSKGKISEEQADTFKRRWRDEYGLSRTAASRELSLVGRGGEQAASGVGGVAIVDGTEVTMTRLGAFPGSREMGFPELRDIPETRICMVFRVHPQIAFALVAFKHPTFAQAKMAEQVQWTQGYLPLWRRIAGKLTTDLRPYYGKNVRVGLDLSEVTALQEDLGEMRKFWLDAFAKGAITDATFAQKVGLAQEQEGEFLRPLNVEEVPAGAKVVEINGRKYVALGLNGGRSEAKVVAPAKVRRYVARIAAMKRDLEGKLIPELDSYFAKQADRVVGRILRQGSAALSLYVETKQQYPFDADDLMPSSEDRELAKILRPRVLEAAEAAWEASAAEFAIDAAFDVSNPQVRSLLAEASSKRVVNITDATRDVLKRLLAEGAQLGLSPFQLANGVGDFAGVRSAVEETYKNRAMAIARTEMGWGSNRGANALYRSEGIEKVEVFDGDFDDACKEADGSTWTLAEAEANPLEHPNCQRAFAPVVEEGS
jgi:phage portal protein BeeE